MIKDFQYCTQAEQESLFNLYRESFVHYAADFKESKQMKLIEFLSASSWFHAFIHIENDQVDGYIFFIDSYSSYLASKVIRIEEVYVSYKHRRQGIGHRLMDITEAYCKQNDIAQIVLNRTTGNAAATQFYEKKGFVSHGQTPLRLNLSI